MGKQTATRPLSSPNGALKVLYLFFLTLLTAFLPNQAYAAGGENVVLNLRSGDMPYLYASLGFAVISLVAAWVLSRRVLAQSPGDEKMQEIGQYIKEGALAYLRKQIGTMIVFVVLLGIILFLIFQPKFGPTLAALTAVSFFGGVLASYVAGFAGMIMAVNGNMRTAHAALSSYKRSTEVAFHSGAVAGLLTVGLGLLGASLIFLFATADAMKLLVGFGFGGSLAALFMRVGGGIYTKAADVGADLVGKVEAGIPEDDPRNPAVIADNVGDNVGDCAGMAADVFESYEVTLVAAIVLGAAASAIFDQATTMKLILFALMARGVGILASIIGIFTFKGNDNLDVDPLKMIRKGFYSSAAVAAVFTVALAAYMMGGPGSPYGPIVSSKISSFVADQNQDIENVRDIQSALAKEQNKEAWEIPTSDVLNDNRLKALNLDPADSTERPIANQVVSQAFDPNRQDLPEAPEYDGYTRIDFADTRNPVLNYAVPAARPANQQQPDPNSPQFVSLKERFENAKLQVFQAKVTTVIPAQPARPGTPAQGNNPEIPGTPARPESRETRTIWAGPMTEDEFNQIVAEVQRQNEEAAKRPAPERVTTTVERLQSLSVNLYANREGDILAGVVNAPAGMHRELPSLNYLAVFKQSPDRINQIVRERQTNPGATTPIPPQEPITIVRSEQKTVAWWLFAAAILFGLLMAFAIEALTDYYVSTHKKPVQEVAGVSTAGPAPMIISGFALALESSVFSVFAIAGALLVPLFLFPPAEYGSYILSFYGIALVGLGLLTTTGYILAMDTFGPISDNAQGVFEMSGAGHTNEKGAKAVARLDAAGNTTKALTKGFAIATAVVAAVALFHSYVEDARLAGLGLPLDMPLIFLGLLIGGAAPFLFSAFSINAVGRAAFQLINEVRRQFRNDPGILAGTSKPDYGTCVAIVTQAAQRELLGPGVLAIALPMAVAFGFSIGQTPVEVAPGVMVNVAGAQALGGFLAGAILSGQLMAVLLANAGGMWDNAKKLIEDGLYGGKGTDAHKAAVVCDTVGDPFKDTAGPALNPLIKVMNLVALLLAPIVIQPMSNAVTGGVTAVCIGLLAFSIWWSKRGSMASAMAEAAVTNPAVAISAPAETASEPAPAAKPKKRITLEDDAPAGEDKK